jgi:hypothetical protein
MRSALLPLWTRRARCYLRCFRSADTGISLHTCLLPIDIGKYLHSIRPSIGRRKDRLENLFCLRCNRELESGHKSVAVYMFAQTVGIKPRQKSAAHRICFCPQCSVSLAMGLPPEGALNVAAWDMIRGLVSSDPGLNQAAWESLRGIVGLLGEAPDEEAPTRSRSETWVNYRRAV